MAVRNRLKGKSIVFTVDAVEYKCDVSSVVLTHEESDDDYVTFCNAEDGGAYEFKLAITALQSTDADSLHTFLWEHAGETVDFVFAPNGNAVPSTSQPHVAGSIKLSNKKPDLGGDASVDGSTWNFDMEFKVEGDVTRITAPTAP